MEKTNIEMLQNLTLLCVKTKNFLTKLCKLAPMSQSRLKEVLLSEKLFSLNYDYQYILENIHTMNIKEKNKIILEDIYNKATPISLSNIEETKNTVENIYFILQNYQYTCIKNIN